MSVTETIRNDLTTAMKARDAERVSTLRMIQAALKNDQIEKGRELSDEEAMVVLRRAVKQRHDAAEQYDRGGRPELAEKERSEITLLEGYLPKAMSDDELEAKLRSIIEETGAASRKDSGRVMKEMMARHKGEVDGRRVQEALAKLLAD